MNLHPLPTESDVQRVADGIASVLVQPCGARDIRVMSRLRQRLQRLRWELVEGIQALRSGGALDLEAQHRVNEANAWLARMSSIEFCVAEQFEARKRPLYAEPVQAGDLGSRQAEICDRFVDSLNGLAGVDSQSEEARAAGLQADIRFSTSEFLRHAHAAARVVMAQGALANAQPSTQLSTQASTQAIPSEPPAFLDVGCGAGQKVLLGLSFFDRADGLELDEGYAKSAHECFRRLRSPARVFKEDAREFNGYGEYRVVYFFKPMADPEGLLELERCITRGVRPGTVLIAPYAGFAQRAESYGAMPIDGAVYLAGSSPEEAEAHREEAMRTGTFIAHGRPPVMVDTVWQQLVMASWMRGFNPLP